jgi:predicted peptidase
MKNILALLIITFILSLQFNNGMAQNIENIELVDGIHKMELPISDGNKLRCSASFPVLNGEGNVPLILALHYGGEVVPYFGFNYLTLLAEPALKDLGAFIIAPDCPGNGWTDEISEKAITELLQYVIEFWPVDTSKIVVTGFSMGGFGAWYFGSKYPDIFCAAIPLAGRPTGDFEMQIPVYALHGQFDEIVDIEPTKTEIKKLKKSGLNARLYVIQGLSHYQTGEYVSSLKKTTKWLKEIWKLREDE